MHWYKINGESHKCKFIFFSFYLLIAHFFCLFLSKWKSRVVFRPFWFYFESSTEGNLFYVFLFNSGSDNNLFPFLIDFLTLQGSCYTIQREETFHNIFAKCGQLLYSFGMLIFSRNSYPRSIGHITNDSHVVVIFYGGEKIIVDVYQSTSVCLCSFSFNLI